MQFGRYDCFHPVLDLGDRKIILFGSGKIADSYLEKYGQKYAPDFIIDSNEEKWGTKKNGIIIKSPESVRELLEGSFRIVIAIKNFEPAAEQLEQMGVSSENYRIYDKLFDPLLSGRLTDTISDGKYKIGYVTGVFDLFHIGHLNLLKNCKTRCHFLIAGVLTDELTEQDKHKKPFIPYEERIEIVKQCRYVDQAVKVDFHNTDKIDAWKELKYGCLFSGSDHEKELYWLRLQLRLRSLGSDLVFFPYTQSTSSTMLQKAIRASCRE